MMTEYVKFEVDKEYSLLHKTKKYRIISMNSGETLGIIKWFPNWRKYVFFPESRTIFDNKCLNEITQYLETLMTERNSGTNS